MKVTGTKKKSSLVQEISKALDMSPISFPMRFQTRFLITRNMWRKRTENTQTLLLIKHAPGHSLPSLKKISDTFLLPLFFRSWMWKKRSISLHHKKDSSLTFMTWLHNWSLHGSFTPARNPKQHLPYFHIFIMGFLFLKIRFTMVVPLSENPIRNISNCSTTVMKSITSGTSAVFSLTAQTTTLKLTFQRKINKRVLPRKTGMNRSLGRPCFWMQTWFRLPCRCIPEMSQRNHTSGISYRRWRNVIKWPEKLCRSQIKA